jgi:hypothetical protein
MLSEYSESQSRNYRIKRGLIARWRSKGESSLSTEISLFLWPVFVDHFAESEFFTGDAFTGHRRNLKIKVYLLDLCKFFPQTT